MRRRSFLKGLSLGAGASLLHPMLQDLEAQAAGTLPQRLVIVQIGNGLAPGYFWDDALAKAIDGHRQTKGNKPSSDRFIGYEHYTHDAPVIAPSLDFSLRPKRPEDPVTPFVMAPLEPYKKEMVLLHGLTNSSAGGGHYTNFGALSCARGVDQPEAITIDSYLGKTLSQGKPFDVLRLAVQDDYVTKKATTLLQDSSYGPSRPAPVFVSPNRAFEYLFGSVLNADSKRAFGKRKQLLDLMNADTKRAMTALSGGPKLRMEHYLHSIETLQERQSRLVEIDAKLQQCVPDTGDHFTSPHPGQRMKANFDLATTALVCGLTNVVIMGTGTGRSTGVRWTDFEIEGEGDFPGGHNMGHGAGYAGKSGSHWLGKAITMHCEAIATMIESLKAVPEGNGTMWDNTVILFQTSNHESHHSRQKEWPAILLGSAGGKINTGGRGIVYPNANNDGHKRVRNLYNTLGHAFGLDLNDFGAPLGRGFDGPLSDLLF